MKTDLDDYLAGSKINTPTTAESVSRVLREAILSGALPGGTVVRQEEMAARFGVSRVPLREALLKLEGEGLVANHPRRGVSVTTLSVEDFEEIIEMRIALESLALGLAARNFEPANAVLAHEIVLGDEEQILGTPVPSLQEEFESRWGDRNWEFHRRLYAPCNRPRLLATIKNLHQLFARHLRMRVSGNGLVSGLGRTTAPEGAGDLSEWAAVVREHRDMVDACERRDPDKAIALLKGHISDRGTDLVHRLRTAK